MQQSDGSFLWDFKGQKMTVGEIAKLPECEVGIGTVRKRLKQGLVGDKVIKTSLKRFEYRGQWLTVPEILALPECQVGANLMRERLNRGLPVEQSLLANLEDYERRQRRKEKLAERERIKAIMAKPVKATATQIYWMGKKYEEMRPVERGEFCR